MKYFLLIALLTPFLCFAQFTGTTGKPPPKAITSGAFGKKPMNCDSLNKIKIGSDYKPIKYKVGFSYVKDSLKHVLLECVPKGMFLYGNCSWNFYTWRVRIEKGGEYGTWTYDFIDEVWIDVARKIAYINKEGGVRYY